MKPMIAALSAVAFAAATPAAAQIAPGMQVTDVNGGAVGVVKAIKGENLVIQTDKHEAVLPKSGFTPSKGKLLFGMTQAQLDTAIETSLAAAKASVAPGAVVKGLSGTEIGKVDSVSETAVIIVLPSGKKIQIARDGVRGNADGSVTVGLTADQLDAQVQGGGGAATSGQ